jgi:hypothetical protein
MAFEHREIDDVCRVDENDQRCEIASPNETDGGSLCGDCVDRNSWNDLCAYGDHNLRNAIESVNVIAYADDHRVSEKASAISNFFSLA